MIDPKPGDAARYRHAECLRRAVAHRCRPCRQEGLAVQVIRVPPETADGPAAIVIDGQGRQFGAWRSELSESKSCQLSVVGCQ